MILDIIVDVLKALALIYSAWNDITENSEEIKRFCRHADNLLKMIQEHNKNRNNLSVRTLRSLRHFQRNIATIQDTVQDLSHANILRRLIQYPSLTRQIQRAYADMGRLTQEFTVIDMNAILHRREAARQRDRRNIDHTCREILEKSNGGSDARKLLETMKILPEDMEQTLVSCSNRLKEDIPSSLERAVLSSVTSALEKRVRKTMAIPSEYIITSLDVVIHHHKRKGQGGFAKVFEGTWQGRLVAVKVLERGLDPKVFEKEIDVWRRLDHQNVLKFYGACSIADAPFMVCELKRYGNINSYLADHNNADRLQLLTDACLGLEYLHQNNVIHGDLKGSNILVGEDKVACLCDFGFSRIKTFQTTLTAGPNRARAATGWGTMRWAAPEQLNYGGTSKEADIYSFAMTMYEIYSGSPPFVEFDIGVIYERVRMGVKPPSLLERQHALDCGLTPEIWQIMSLAWRRQPVDRPTASTVAFWLKHPNAVYSASGSSPQREGTGHNSPPPSSKNGSAKRLRKQSKVSLRVEAGVPDPNSYKPRPDHPELRKTPSKYGRSPKGQYDNAAQAEVPHLRQGTFRPVGPPLIVPYGGPGMFGPTHSRPGESSSVFPFGDLGPLPPGAVPTLQIDHGAMIVPEALPLPGIGMPPPLGTFIPSGPPTYLAPPVPFVKKSRSKGRLRGWFSF